MATETTMNMFEKASRMRLRFESARGALSVEDLWALPLTVVGSNPNSVSLDIVARATNKKLKEAETESFVVKNPKADETLQLRMDIVKYIIDVKLNEAQDAEAARIKRAQKEKILEIVSRKQDQALEGKSLEELQAMLASL